MVDLEQQWLHQARRATFEDYRRRHVSTWIAPRGGSMRPLIDQDTWMLVEFGATNIRVGDIVLFPLGNVLVAHRVVVRRVRLDRTLLISKGDAEPFYDAPIPAHTVIGIVRALREGRTGPTSRFGCGGRSARAIAFVSRVHGRSAWLARRAAAFLPDPLRRPAQRVVPPFARVVARVLFALLPWAAWLKIQIQQGRG
jgi:hypothetical protein